jgi:hypothetical protein
LVQELEVLVRTAIFKPANALVGHLLQAAADRIDAAYQPRPGQVYKGRQECQVQGLFGCFPLERDYHYSDTPRSEPGMVMWGRGEGRIKATQTPVRR